MGNANTQRYNQAVGEMKGSADSAPSAPSRTQRRARLILALLLWGAGLTGLAPLYAWLGLNYSGKLALAQTASADQTARGFDFGPVYLEEGATGRYYLSAVLPAVEGGVWQTSFEVLDSQRQPVYRQNELRFIGDFMFQPGQRDRYQKTFTLDRGTGYYYFHFKALNGVYNTEPGAPPVVEFALRQRVLDGWALWGPAGGLLATGLMLLGLASGLIRRVGAEAQQRLLERQARRAAPPAEDLSPLGQRMRRRQIPLVPQQ
jgi:hypothetical protein